MEEESMLYIKRMEEEEKRAQEERRKLLEMQNLATCDICMDEIEPQDLYPIDICGHIFHLNCISQHIKIKIKDRSFPILCPKINCKMNISEIDVRNLSDKEILDDFYQFSLQKFAESNTDDYSFCPTPDCKYIFIFNQGVDSNDFNCPLCKKRYCLNCRCIFHEGMTCQEYKINSNYSEEDKQFIQFVKGQKFKQCPKCKFWVEKNQGCDHMSCRCGMQFCYKCGGIYQQCECVLGRAAVQNPPPIVNNHPNILSSLRNYFSPSNPPAPRHRIEVVSPPQNLNNVPYFNQGRMNIIKR